MSRPEHYKGQSYGAPHPTVAEAAESRPEPKGATHPAVAEAASRFELVRAAAPPDTADPANAEAASRPLGAVAPVLAPRECLEAPVYVPASDWRAVVAAAHACAAADCDAHDPLVRQLLAAVSAAHRGSSGAGIASVAEQRLNAAGIAAAAHRGSSDTDTASAAEQSPSSGTTARAAAITSALATKGYAQQPPMHTSSHSITSAASGGGHPVCSSSGAAMASVGDRGTLGACAATTVTSGACVTTKTRHLNRPGQLSEFEQESNTAECASGRDGTAQRLHASKARQSTSRTVTLPGSVPHQDSGKDAASTEGEDAQPKLRCTPTVARSCAAQAGASTTSGDTAAAQAGAANAAAASGPPAWLHAHGDEGKILSGRKRCADSAGAAADISEGRESAGVVRHAHKDVAGGHLGGTDGLLAAIELGRALRAQACGLQPQATQHLDTFD